MLAMLLQGGMAVMAPKCLAPFPWRASYQSQSVQSIRVALRLKHHAQLVNHGNLLLGQVSRVAILRLSSVSREVIVIVLGVDIHGGVRMKP